VKRSLLKTAAIIIAVIIADQISKAWAEISYQDGARQIVGSLVKLVSVDNSGVAFGQFAGLGAMIFIVIFLVSAFLIVYLIKNPRQPLLATATGLIIGGALGNAIDRIDSGAVYDFISIGPWPAFNLADSAIVIGAILLFVTTVKYGGGKNRDSEKSIPPPQSA